MGKNIKILVIYDSWLHPFHTNRSANIIIYELIKGLSDQPGFEIGFIKVDDRPEREISDEEKNGIKGLEENGVNVLKPIYLLKPSRRSRLLQFFQPQLRDVYPSIVHRPKIEKEIQKFAPDMLFIPLSEWLTALAAEIKIPKFAYYGNPDPKVALARIDFACHHGDMSRLKFSAIKKIIKSFEKIHLRAMGKYDIFGDVAANDAQYYIDNGHPNAFYIQHIWLDRFGPSWREKRKILEKESSAMIVGSIGKLNATANSRGIEILGRDLLPELKRKLKGKNYEIHIFGGEKLHPSLEKYFKTPEVKIRGWVPDIDKEMLASKVFLCLNNASDYKVGHTRYLHAWSLGCCVIAHADSALSMPEIKHRENALLGRNPAEIADLIVEALANPDLRLKIGEGGYQTFKNYFTADKVVPKIAEKIRTFFKI